VWMGKLWVKSPEEEEEFFHKIDQISFEQVM
jgi:hypothetical protein